MTIKDVRTFYVTTKHSTTVVIAIAYLVSKHSHTIFIQYPSVK